MANDLVLHAACRSFVLWRISALVAVAPILADAGLMPLLGLLGVVSHFCLIRAFAAAPASTIAPFGYTALFWATLFSLIVFAEVPGPRTLFGAGLIVGAGLFIVLRGRG